MTNFFTTNGKSGYPLPIVTFEHQYRDYSQADRPRVAIIAQAEVLTVNINSGSMRVRFLPGQVVAGTEDISAQYFFDQFSIKKD
jgi:hypothetical protein